MAVQTDRHSRSVRFFSLISYMEPTLLSLYYFVWSELLTCYLKTFNMNVRRDAICWHWYFGGNALSFYAVWLNFSYGVKYSSYSIDSVITVSLQHTVLHNLMHYWFICKSFWFGLDVRFFCKKKNNQCGSIEHNTCQDKNLSDVLKHTQIINSK